MAFSGNYGNQLADLINNPGSFSGTPGFKFALDTGLESVRRRAAAGGMRDSGNQLAELTKYGTGLATQDYGNQVDRLTKLYQGDQTYDLGQTANTNNATRNANDLTLGLGANANNATRNANDLTLGLGANENNANRNANDYSLGLGRNANELTLGLGQNANNAQRNLNDYSLGAQRNNNEAANNQNNFNLGTGRNSIDWYNAQTGRGAAQSNAYNNEQANQRAWYSIYPRQRVAGQP
jgi:hypothetical protein